MTLAERTTVEGGEPLDEQWRRAQAELRVLTSQVTGISGELRELARREAVLARAEAQENAALAAQGVGFGGGTAVVALYVLGFLGLALTFGLGEFIPLWASALVTALLFGVVVAVLGTMARSRFSQFSLTPKRTMRSLREDMQWARAQMRRSAP